MLQAQPAIVEQCPAAAVDLFHALRRMAGDRPGLALACAPLLKSETQRELVYREAFIAAMSVDPAAARPYVKRFLDRSWLCDAGFFPALAVASVLAPGDLASARELLLAAARRHPGVALREAGSYLGLPFGGEVFEDAIEGAPDEAAGLASGNSSTANTIRGALERSERPALKVLARFATGDAGVAVRERAAVFFRAVASGAMTEARALEIGAGDRYFSEVAALRSRSPAADEAMLDRVLERSAQMLFRSMESGPIPSELLRLTAGDAYLMLTYGRTEADILLFGRVFDAVLVPKLRAERRSVLSLLDSAGDPQLRRFLGSAAANERLEAFLRIAGRDADQVLTRCFRGLDKGARPLDEALAAEAVLDGLTRPDRLEPVAAALVSEHARAVRDGSAEGPPLFGLLAAALVRKLPEQNRARAHAVNELAGRHLRHFKEPRTLQSDALFDAAGTFVQQHFFYDDDDGVESFESFRNTYAGANRTGDGKPAATMST